MEIDSARAHFKAHVKKWKAERDPTEMTIRSIRHPAYRAIIEMDWLAVPLLLEELQKDPDEWFPALAEITGQSPYEADDLGRFERKTEAWLKWGRKHGIIH